MYDRDICLLGIQSIPRSELLSDREKIALLNELESGLTDMIEEVRKVRDAILLR